MSESVMLMNEPRKRLTAEQKLAIVKQSYEAGAVVVEVARKHRVGVSSLLKWRKLASNGSLLGIKSEEPPMSAIEAKKLKKRIRELERMLGRKTLENEVLKDAIEIAREKKLISRQPLPYVDDIAND
jgi:transposase